MTNDLTLKPCPNCGGEASFCMSKPECGRVKVHCYKCGLSTTWRNGFKNAARSSNEEFER